MNDRSQMVARREIVLAALAREEGQCFFGNMYPGSAEYTHEGYRAAQASASRKERLREELNTLNQRLGGLG
jgi:hypothetical protein